MMKRIPLVLLTLFLTAASTHAFDEHPIDAGARSLGMGGTWTAAGRGYHTLAGNPALLQRTHFVELGANGSNLVTPQARYNTLESFGVVLPISLRTSIAMSYNRLLNYLSPYYGNSHVSGGPFTITPGFGHEIAPGLSLGVAVRIVAGLNKYRRHDYPDDRYSGVSYQFGMAYDAAERFPSLPLTVAFSLRPPWEFTMESSWGLVDYKHGVSLKTDDSSPRNSRMEPFEVTLGLDWQPTDRLSVAADLEYLRLETLNQDRYHYPIYTWSLLGYRLGMEYLVPLNTTKTLALRTGLFSSPFRNYYISYYKPANSLVLCSPTYGSGLTLGTGVDLGLIRLDAALYWLRGDLTTIETAPTIGGIFDSEDQDLRVFELEMSVNLQYLER